MQIVSIEMLPIFMILNIMPAEAAQSLPLNRAMCYFIAMRLESTIENLLTSYSMYKGTASGNDRTFPNRQTAIGILQDIECLIFPGFSTSEAITPQNIRYITGERVNRVIPLLTQEIQKAFTYSASAVNLEYDADMEQEIAGGLLNELPEIRRKLILDANAIYNGDPAAVCFDEVVTSYPGLEAIMVHRIAHFLFKKGVPVLPRIMSEYVHGKTGIDIHPGATIGESFFIDHGTGIVIGETCIIGNNVKIYQGVTLGALSVEKELQNTKRHPTIEDDVTVYSGATILGGRTVIGRGATVGGNTWITRSIAPGTTVVAHYSEETKERAGNAR